MPRATQNSQAAGYALPDLTHPPRRPKRKRETTSESESPNKSTRFVSEEVREGDSEKDGQAAAVEEEEEEEEEEDEEEDVVEARRRAKGKGKQVEPRRTLVSGSVAKATIKVKTIRTSNRGSSAGGSIHSAADTGDSREEKLSGQDLKEIIAWYGGRRCAVCGHDDGVDYAHIVPVSDPVYPRTFSLLKSLLLIPEDAVHRFSGNIIPLCGSPCHVGLDSNESWALYPSEDVIDRDIEWERSELRRRRQSFQEEGLDPGRSPYPFHHLLHHFLPVHSQLSATSVTTYPAWELPAWNNTNFNHEQQRSRLSQQATLHSRPSGAKLWDVPLDSRLMGLCVPLAVFQHVGLAARSATTPDEIRWANKILYLYRLYTTDMNSWMDEDLPTDLAPISMDLEEEGLDEEAPVAERPGTSPDWMTLGAGGASGPSSSNVGGARARAGVTRHENWVKKTPTTIRKDLVKYTVVEEEEVEEEEEEEEDVEVCENDSRDALRRTLSWQQSTA